MTELHLDSPEAQAAFGARIAALISPPAVIYLEGDLGAGKTTLARGILYGLGHRGAARSPTYTLIEPYSTASGMVYHLDLYRLGDPEELEYLGLRDLLEEDAILIVEWPDRGAGLLPAADVLVRIDYRGSGRGLSLTAASERGRVLLEGLRDLPG